jgi:hypothetical protein
MSGIAIITEACIDVKTHYNSDDTGKGHDHTFFIQHTREVFAD